MHLTRIGILAILWILASNKLDAQDTPLLLKEVISREFSIHVGGVQTPEQKQIVSRELSVFVGAEPEPAFRQVISREVSLVVKTPPVPARVAQLAVSPSPTGETIGLSWEAYNEWAELDVARYDIYVSTHPFTNISSMTRYATVPAETRSLVLDGFSAWEDRFFAVVAVDAGGGFDPVVNYAAAYPIAREVVSREMSVFVGGEPEPPFKQVISREVSVVVHTPEVPARVTQLVATPTPSGETTTLSWAGYNQWAEQDVVRYDIYLSTRGFTNVSEMQRYASVPGETFTVTLDGFMPWQDLCFAVVPVDAAGGFDPVVKYAAAYTIAKEVVSREMSVFVGGEPEPPYQQIISREVSLVVGTPEIPAPVTGVDSGFAANLSTAAYGAIDMDWSSYNEYAQADVVRYRVYAGPTYFDDVSAMEPYAYVPAEQTHWTLTGLNPLGIYHLAVVAEDSLGQWNPAVRSFSAQASIGALGEARNLAVTSDTNALHFSWVPPDGTDPFLSYYRVYFGGAIAPVTVDRSATVYDATDLQPSHGYPFRITTVDKFGKESEGASLLAATLLDQPTNLTVQGLDGIVRLSWNHVEPNELVYKYAVYVSITNFASVSNLTPVLLTRAHTADVPGLTNAVTYFFAVTTINLCGGERKDVQAMSTAPQPVPGHFADLVITNVESLTASLYPGHSANFGWRVFNAGAASTSSKDGQSVAGWMDRIILSRDDVLGDADDVTVANIPHTGALALSQAYQTNVTVQIPRIAPGEYFVFIATDANDQVYELLDEGSNVAVAESKLKLRLTVPLPDVTVAELKQLTVTNLPAAADVPAAALTFEVASAPTGVAVDAHSGVVAWTPAEDQGPGRYLIAVRVTDNRSPSLVETNAFYVDVSEANRPPTLTPTAFMAVAEGSQLTFTAKGTDADVPAQALTFSLEPGAPNGSSITPGGVFTWTPTKAQAASTNTVSIRVSDGIDSSVGTVSIYVAARVPDPVLVGKWPQMRPGLARRVQVEGNLAYVAGGHSGLQIFDVRGATNPVYVGTYDECVGDHDTLGDVRAVHVLGSMAYIAAAQSGLHVIDVSEPANPVRVGSIGALSMAVDVRVVGNMAYVADGRAGLQIVDVSDAAHPVRAASYPTADQVLSVNVVGRLAYVAVANHGIEIIDVSNLGSLVQVGSVVTGGPVWEIQVVGSMAYVAAAVGLQVFDVSNPAKPILSGDYRSGGRVNGVQVVGNLAYLAASNGLQVIDIANPANSHTLGDYGTTNEAHGVQVVGSVAYVTDSIGLEVVDVSKPTMPLPLGQYFYKAGWDISRLDVVSNVVYAADRQAGLDVIDITEPSTPLLLGRYGNGLAAVDVQVVGNLAYVADELSGMQVFDISNPSQPIRVGMYDSATRSLYDKPRSVRVIEHTAYLSCGVAGVHIIDVSDPFKPLKIGGLDGNGAAIMRVQVVDTLAYVVDLRNGETAGLQVVDVTNPSSPVRLGGCDTGIGVSDVQVVGKLAYVVNCRPGLVVIDVSDPGKPALVGTCSTGGQAFGLHVVGNLAYVAGWGGLQIIDVSHPTNPVCVGSYPARAGYALDVHIVGNLAYLVDRGLVALRLVPNRPPVLAPIVSMTVAEETPVSFTATATDADVPAQPLTFSLGEGAPTGANITSEGAFTWTPTETQGPSTNLITIRVSDGVTNAAQTFQIVVTEVSTAPTLAILDQIIPELQPSALTLAGTDADLPAQTLTYVLLAGPDGLTLAGNQLAWTPTEAQGPSTNAVTVKVIDNGEPALSATDTFRIIVTEVNSAPTLATLDQTIPELQPLTLSLAATDADLPAQTLSYTLLTGPSGLSLAGKQILWTPTEAQGPSTNTVTVKVTDNGTPALSATNAFRVIVTEVNLVPSLAVADQTIPEQQPFALTLAATDADLPAQTLTYALLSGPSGLSLAGKQLLWTPTEAQGPSTNSVTVKVTDNGTPALSATNAFKLVVAEVNLPPVLAAITAQTVTQETLLTFTATATDPDMPGQTLTFSLVGSVPAGVSITPVGVFTWTPTSAQCPSTNQITVKVTDDGTPRLSEVTTFTVVAKATLHLAAAKLNNDGSITLSWPIVLGWVIQAEYNDDLRNPIWTPLSNPVSINGGIATVTDHPAAHLRFYRLRRIQ